MTDAIALREITVERATHPAGFFIVTMRDESEGDGEYCRACESADLAFAEADHLKRDYAPAVIRDRTGGAL